ncbi:MAG: type II toxin-antitoxin system HipA family toxin [Deltaproteobacteria bacterium]|nr:type II toxin-antitoxin system HipA family toxin [Deltaproteobacteria bacterium]
MDNINQKQIEVWADWHILKTPQRVGVLTTNVTRGKEIFSFEYEPTWLKITDAFQLDPALKLYSGRQYLTENKPNFGIFLDSSPDRWGRTLIQRREIILAHAEKRQERKLFESDFLLGVFDLYRMGGLRFKYADGPFLDDNKEYATPPWSSIRELETISLKLEEKNIENSPQYSKWLQILFAPGSSLGGSRPKATVRDPKNHLWIAKFPSRSDTHDVGAWEYVVYQLAKRCSINVPEAQVMKVSSKYHTFLSKRFDRTPSGKRIHFSSAMTLLERKDGDNTSIGASYLEIVNLLIETGTNTNKDLEELWKRIVFSICVSNTDDHLRNHGFLLTSEGWQLSPAYDMNPNEYANGLCLNISETSNEQSLELALKAAENFRVDQIKAKKMINQIKTEISKWPLLANKLKISSRDKDRMTQAFRLAK